LKINNEKRIFIGIPISGKIKPILPSIKFAIICNPNYIKWIPLENIHLTLSFLGNIRTDDMPNLIESLEKKITSNNFQFAISGAGVFPSSNYPKVLWLGIGKGLDELTSLQRQVENSIRKYIENSQGTIFTPHITIAKIRRLHGKIDVLPFLNTVYSPIELDVNSISLFESQLLPEGVQYSILNTFPLN